VDGALDPGHGVFLSTWGTVRSGGADDRGLEAQQATGLGPMSAGGPASGVGPRTGPAQAARPGPRPGSGPVPGAGKPPGGPSRPVWAVC